MDGRQMDERAGNAEAASGVSDRELVFARVFDAPAALVFAAWTDPAHLAHWWGPDGFTLTTEQLEARPGGHWRFVMHGPDGRDYRNHIVFRHVEPPVRLVYDHVPEPGTEPVQFTVTVTFAESAGRTHMEMRMLFASKAARDHVVTTYGADQGARQTLSRLAAYVATLARP